MDEPRFIYKFYSSKKYNIEALENNLIYFNPYYKFNDPFEYKFTAEVYDACELVVLKELKNRGYVFDNKNGCLPISIFNYAMNSIRNKKNISIYDIIKNSNDLLLKKRIIRIENKFKKKIWNLINNYLREKYYCFSSFSSDVKPGDFNMWYAYANNHKGFLVQYDLRDINEYKFHKVKYSNRETIIKLGNLLDYYFNDNDTNIIKALDKTVITKKLCWKTEKEYRLFSDKKGLNDFLPARNVICGLNMDEDYAKKVYEICLAKGIGCYFIYKDYYLNNIQIGPYYKMMESKIRYRYEKSCEELYNKLEIIKMLKSKDTFEYMNIYISSNLDYGLWTNKK